MLNKIQEIETAARAKGPGNDNALQAFALAKVARIIVGKAEHTTDLSIECPGDAFDDILRLYTNGGGGNRLLEHMAELNLELPEAEETEETAKESGYADLDALRKMVQYIASQILECDEPAGRAVLAVARRYKQEITSGFPSAEPVIAHATELLAAA